MTSSASNSSTPYSITTAQLYALLGTATTPIILDVRRQPAFDADACMIAGAQRVAPDGIIEWSTHHARQPVITYCVAGHEVSQEAARVLNEIGFTAKTLEGGIEGWRAEGQSTSRPMVIKNAALNVPGGSSWVTRERPKIDRVACPWLIKRFIDPLAQFHYVPSDQVMAFAHSNNATPYDVKNVQFSHRGELCSFDALIADFALNDAALNKLATIVRGADTDALHLAPQSAGLLAMSLGLSANNTNDHAMLARAMVMYDALYAWCQREVHGDIETHQWAPA